MKKILILAAVLITCRLASGEEVKVYTDKDLQRYRGTETPMTNEESLRYQAERQAADDKYWKEKQQRANEDALLKYKEIELRQDWEQRIKKDRALKRIGELEEEKAKDKTERDFIGGYVGKRNAEERHKRAINREAELDNAYREAGLSRERELQKKNYRIVRLKRKKEQKKLKVSSIQMV